MFHEAQRCYLLSLNDAFSLGASSVAGAFLICGPRSTGSVATACRFAQATFGGSPLVIPLHDTGGEDGVEVFKRRVAAGLERGDHCHRVIVFDEVENASPAVVALLTMMLDQANAYLPEGGILSVRQYYFWFTASVPAASLVTAITERIICPVVLSESQPMSAAA